MRHNTNKLHHNLSWQLAPQLIWCTFCHDFDTATSMIGEGGFSQVFRGTYRETPVAIKRLKIHEIDIVKLTPRERARQIRRIQAEAAVMSACCIHPNITVRECKER